MPTAQGRLHCARNALPGINSLLVLVVQLHRHMSLIGLQVLLLLLLLYIRLLPLLYNCLLLKAGQPSSSGHCSVLLLLLQAMFMLHAGL